MSSLFIQSTKNDDRISKASAVLDTVQSIDLPELHLIAQKMKIILAMLVFDRDGFRDA